MYRYMLDLVTKTLQVKVDFNAMFKISIFLHKSCAQFKLANFWETILKTTEVSTCRHDFTTELEVEVIKLQHQLKINSSLPDFLHLCSSLKTSLYDILLTENPALGRYTPLAILHDTSRNSNW